MKGRKGPRQMRTPSLADEFRFAARVIEGIDCTALANSIEPIRESIRNLHPALRERVIYELTMALSERANDIKGRLHWMASGQKIRRKIGYPSRD